MKFLIIILLLIFFINICQSIKFSNNENFIDIEQEYDENHLIYKRQNEKRERDIIKNKEIEKRRFKNKSSSSSLKMMKLKSGSSLPLANNEKLILEILYSAWNGDDWFNKNNKWLNGDPCIDNWFGIECNVTSPTSTTSNVVKLNLKSNNVKGEIPIEMKELIHLEYIEFSNNEMYGEIPIGVFENMLNLEYFAINDNLFSGHLEWSNHMPMSIVTLWISYNNFTGAGIPTFLGKYPVLDLLFLEGNTLQGSIPPEIGQLQNIKLLDFGFNELTGSLPVEIGNLVTLEFFWLYDNSLSSSLPTSLSNLINLELFEVTRNSLDGSLNGVFENNLKFKSIRFSSNSFSGDLNWICKLPALKDAHFSSNRFEHLPDCPGQVPLGLNELLLANNLISGTIPSSFGKFQGIEYLGLSGNSLNGIIPITFSNFTNLNRIDISKNNFSCSLSQILDPIKYQTHLTIISANSNQIYGEFLEDMFWDGDQEIELLTKMFIINLANNRISGPIKEYLSWMPNLNDLDLSNNNLTGTVPNQLNYLSTFYLENNPNLKDDSGNLPSFMKPSSIMIHKDSETYACPSIIGKGFDIRITLDSSYYNNSLCLCDYTYRGVNGSCKLCPTDSYCPGSGNQILIPSGYFPMPSLEEPEYLLKCIVSNFGKTSCNPDNSYNYTCASGYQGRLCSKCTEGYFHKGTECSVCPTGPQSIVIFVVVVIVFIALFLFFVMTDPKRSLPSSTRKTVMYYYQVFNLLLSKLSPWPSFFSIFYSGSSWLNFSFGFLCINNLSRWPNLFIVMICLPFAFLVISIVFITMMQIYQYIKSRYGLFSCGGSKTINNGATTKGSTTEEGESTGLTKKFVLDKKLIYSGIRVNLLALNFLYLPLCIYIFQNYPCTKDLISGEEYMSFFPWQQCGDNPTHNRIMSLTIAFTIIYVIGIPLLFSILLFANRKRLDHPLVLTMIGSIYIDYRKSVYWYELVALGRRFFMAVSLALIDPKSSFSIFVVLLVIGSSIISQIIFKPYVYRISNYAETIGNSVLLFSYACILLLSSLETTKLYDSKGIEIILSVVVVLYTVLLLLLFLFSLKYFLPRKWQMVVDSNLIKFINWVRLTTSNFIKDNDFLSKQNDPDDSFETTKEPIFERTISNNLNILGSNNNIELKRRNSSALQQSSTQNSNSSLNNNINNNSNNNNNNNNNNQDGLISLSIDNSGSSFNNDSNKNI